MFKFTLAAFAALLIYYTVMPREMTLTVIHEGTAFIALPDGGATPYTYHWSNGETNAVLHPRYAGIYTLTVTDKSGRVKNAVLDLSVPSIPK